MSKQGSTAQLKIQEIIEKTKQKTNLFYLNRTQKILLTLLLFLLFTLLVISAPFLFRDYYAKRLKIPKEVFLSQPVELSINSFLKNPDSYYFKMGNFNFPVPNDFTPTEIYTDSAVFKRAGRSRSRKIRILDTSIDELPPHQTYNYLVKSSIPLLPQQFFEAVLNETWHPIRLIAKGKLYVDEGITNTVYKNEWPGGFKGYILPLSGNKGYKARVFTPEGQGAFLYEFSDSVKPVTLQEWNTLAAGIDTIFATAHATDDFDKVLEYAKNQNTETKALSIALSEFYETGNPEWILPILQVMASRGFISEFIKNQNRFSNSFPQESNYISEWNALYKTITEKHIKIETDPKMASKALNVYCTNLTDKEIIEMTLNFTVTSETGTKHEFSAQVLREGRIMNNQEKALLINVPDNVSIAESVKIECCVEKVVFAN